MSSSSDPENVNVSENGEVGCDGAESEWKSVVGEFAVTKDN